jgi:hypothetical protein
MKIYYLPVGDHIDPLHKEILAHVHLLYVGNCCFYIRLVNQ